MKCKLTISQEFRDMRDAKETGDKPLEVALSHFALKRVVAFLETGIALGLEPSPEFYFGGIDPSEFRDIHEFSVKYGFETIQEGLDAMAAECLEQIKCISLVFGDSTRPFLIKRRKFDELIGLLTSLPWSVLGTMELVEALDPRWIAPFLRAAFGSQLKPDTDRNVPAIGFAEEFEKSFTVRESEE